MLPTSHKRAATLLAAGLALAAPDLAAGVRRAEGPALGFTPRTVGEAISGKRQAPHGALAFPRPGNAPAFPVRGPAGYGESAARFGSSRGGRSHEGQDVFAPAGTPLVAVRDGRVVETGDDGGRGNYVAIYSPAARQTYVYLHMSEPARVPPGGRVRAGRRVGSVGCTGSCFGDHLHFEVRRGRGTQGAPVDPLPLLLRWRSSGHPS